MTKEAIDNQLIDSPNMGVNNALTQIPFNGTNFINARLTQRVFSV